MKIRFASLVPGVLAAVALLAAVPAHARTLAEVKSLGAISMCANAGALPWSSNKPETPGFQIELGRSVLLRSRPFVRHVACSSRFRSTTMPGINWTDRFDEALTRARGEQRDILLDFSAAPM